MQLKEGKVNVLIAQLHWAQLNLGRTVITTEWRRHELAKDYGFRFPSFF